MFLFTGELTNVFGVYRITYGIQLLYRNFKKNILQRALLNFCVNLTHDGPFLFVIFYG